MTSLYENTARTLNLANVVSNVPKNIPHQGRMWSVLSPVTFYTLVRSRVRYFFFLKHFCQCSLARNFVSFAIFENDFCITLFVVVSWRWRIRVLYEEIKTRWSVKWTECMRHTGHSEKNSFQNRAMWFPVYRCYLSVYLWFLWQERKVVLQPVF